MNIVIDIETIPDQSPAAKQEIAETIKHPAQMKKQETINDWHYGNGKYAGEKDKAIDEKYLKTSFDGGYGEIICICVDIDGDKGIFSNKKGEQNMLIDFWDAIETATPAPYFIAHNAKFDLPFLWHRSIVNSVSTKGFSPHGRHNSNHYCTMEAWAGFNGKIGLDRLAKILGFPGKTEGMDGSQVWPEYQKGNLNKIIDYCMDDVQLTKHIFERMTCK